MALFNDPNVSETPEETPEEKAINDKIDLWHMDLAGLDQDLHEYLGWTWEQYTHWVTTGELPNV